jgi:hypothetical protein
MPEPASVKVVGLLVWPRAVGSTTAWGSVVGERAAVAVSARTHTMPPPRGRREGGRRSSYCGADTGSPQLYRHIRAQEEDTAARGHGSPLNNDKAHDRPTAGPPFPRYAQGSSEEASEGPRRAKIPGRWKRRQPCPPSRAGCDSSDTSGEQARSSHERETGIRGHADK